MSCLPFPMFNMGKRANSKNSNKSSNSGTAVGSGRKALQTLPQAIVNEVPSVKTNTVLDKAKEFVKMQAISEIKEVGKENSPLMLRRSQRQQYRNNFRRSQTLTSPKSLKKNLRKPLRKQSLSTDTLVQSRLSFVPLPKNSPKLKEPESQKIPEDLKYLVTDDLPESYWQQLAEVRGAALEDTLRENQSLRDQLTVLETENEFLMAATDNAKELAKFVLTTLCDNDFREFGLSKDDVQALMSSR